MKEENNELRDWFLNEISKIDITGDKQNQDTKWLDKWQKLKEWVSFTQPKNINDEFISGVCSAYSNVIDKMRELEGEDE